MKYLIHYSEHIDLNSWDTEEEDTDDVPRGDIPPGLSSEGYNRYLGATVRIKPSSHYYSYNSLSNPRDTDGTIIEIRTSGVIVLWGSSIRNAYGIKDLIVV